MPYIQFQDHRFPLTDGRTRVGTSADAEIRVPGNGADTVEAIVELAKGQAVVRKGSPTASIRVNGVQLGAEPSPLIHGDKIEIAGAELLFGDDAKVGSTQFISGAALASMVQQRAGGKPTAATGGRLVSLVDGREYSVPTGGLIIGREAECDVVVPASEVSRRHAQVVAVESGYQVRDLSTNGVFVNGQKVPQHQLLGRGDVIRVGKEEFRFYADTPAKAAGPPAAPTPAVIPPALEPTMSMMPAGPRPGAPSPVTPANAGAPTAPPPAVTPAKAVAQGAPPPLAAAPAQPRPPAPPAPAPRPPAPPPKPPAPAPPTTPARPTDARPVLATLEIINEGVHKGKRFEVRGPLTHIGRGVHNDIAIDDESVSDTHAKLQKREDAWYVVDAGSTNGTYVGGRRLSGDQRLEGAPDIRVGNIKMTFRPMDSGAAEAKSTRMIAGVSLADAQKIAQARAGAKTPTPPRAIELTPPPVAVTPAPAARTGVPGWVWAVVGMIIVGLAVGFFLRG